MFTRNELEGDDVAYLDHEFLKSMGISIAKHRLEILKLAMKAKKKSRGGVLGGGGSMTTTTAQHMHKLLTTTLKRTKSCISKYMHILVHPNRRDSSSIVIARGDRRRGTEGALKRRDRKMVVVQQGRLMFTNGGVKVSSSCPSPLSRGATTPLMVSSCHCKSGDQGDDDDDDDDGYRGSNDGVTFKWDSMFKDLKPT